MNEIFEEFQQKILTHSLSEQDFVDRSLFNLFRDQCMAPLIARIAECSSALFVQGEDKYIFHIPLGDEWEVRVDFVREDNAYKLVFLDSYTIPLTCVDALPFHDFTPMPKWENRMREEYRITRIIHDYVRLIDIIGKNEAINWFKDGQGEKSGVIAWMPYFTKRKAFVAYTAWMQNRIFGEDIYIMRFSEEESELFFRNSNWLYLYQTATHIKQMITYEAYIELFESIWQDRAAQNDLHAVFSYDACDVKMLFYAV